MKNSNPTISRAKQPNLKFKDLYEEMSHDWQSRAAALQARRWRALAIGRDIRGREY